MFEDITKIDLKILSLYAKDYSSSYSMRQITRMLNINYPNAFKRIKKLVKNSILLEKRIGNYNAISLNIHNQNTIHFISFVEQTKTTKLNTALSDVIKEAVSIDPFACIGLFGSRVSGKAAKSSDWDVFVITNKEKKREMEKIMSKFPDIENIQLQVFSLEEFEESLLSYEETVVKHIVKNKQIIYNSYPFYNLIQKWEMIKYAPTQKS